jgi:hypothetical protein
MVGLVTVKLKLQVELRHPTWRVYESTTVIPEAAVRAPKAVSIFTVT